VAGEVAGETGGVVGEAGGVAGEVGGGDWRGRLAGEVGGGDWRGGWRGTGGGEFNAQILLSRRLSSAYFCPSLKSRSLNTSRTSTELLLADFIPRNLRLSKFQMTTCQFQQM
jgi:hypothetical protein